MERTQTPAHPARQLALLALLFGLISSLSLPSSLSAGSITYEVYQGIGGGTSISDLKGASIYPDSPTQSSFLTDFFETPTNWADEYGARVHGYILPPKTGNYTFWIATDDAGELWLSTDTDPNHKQLIAWVNGWAASRQWFVEPNQQSAPIHLEAGKTYYISALMKEGYGGDNLAVRWEDPDGIIEEPIPATYLLPYGVAFTPPVIDQQPTNTTAIEGGTAVFKVTLKNLDAVTCQWYRNNTIIPGATGTILNYSPVSLLADQNARFKVALTNSLGFTNSVDAILTVNPDVTKPSMDSAINQGATTVRVVFSEPVTLASATAASNYKINGNVTVSSASLGTDNRTVLLATSSLTYGTLYTLTVTNVADRAVTPNLILPGSSRTFVAVEYVPSDIGAPTTPGTNAYVPGGYDVTGAGNGIGGVSDQFQYSYRQVSGDFDFQTRIDGLPVTDAFLRAGLMARESLGSNSRFAAAFASSVQLGCFFESRTSPGAASTQASPAGGFPPNYPQAWLRLQRQGSTLSGYGSFDGQTWYLLGSVTFGNLPQTLYYGLAVSSDNPATATTARFRNLGSTASLSVATYEPRGEPLGPSSRRTGLIVSEIMYHPKARTDARNLQFVELYNSRSVPEELTGWRLSGDIDYRFPDGYILPAGAFAVVAAMPADLTAVYGITNVLGPFTNSLPNDSGKIRLRNNADAVRLEIDYSDNPPWPAAADGAGHSLVLARPSYGEGNVQAWGASALIGGSPGGPDPQVTGPLANVMINEFLAHTDDPQVDYIELYNHSNQPVDISGCYLTDDPATNRFRIPSPTVLQPREARAFDQNQLGFRLNAAGETIYFVHSNLTQVIDSVRFGGQENGKNGVVTGRYPDGDPVFRRLRAPTPSAANAPWKSEDVVINEIMYHPISESSDDEYIELYNRGASPVDLTGWRLGGGISFNFPSNVTIPKGGYLVVAKNAAHLQPRYPQLNTNNCLGDFQGTLSDAGDRITLTMPDTIASTNDLGLVVTNVIHIAIQDLRYGNGGRWGQWSDGGGSSLELIDAAADPLRAANWADSDETTKSTYTTVTATTVLDNGNTDGRFVPDRLHLLMQGPGECLVDDIEVFLPGGANLLSNPGFESGVGTWEFMGNHSTSSVQSSGANTGSRCLHVRGTGDGDTGINSIRTPIAGLSPGNTVTFRARVRWLAGWPEILFRTRGNWGEMPARMNVPTNLGTPGAVNSRRVANAGPATYDVRHDPAVPRAGQAVRVTCRVSDPNGLSQVNLYYRQDPDTILSSIAMRDDGMGGDSVPGDGLFTASLPAYGDGALVAFRIEATDASSSFVKASFPPVGKPECLIRWGDPVPFGTFAQYHMWNTAAVEDERRNTVALNNTWRDATLVYGTHRVIYNVGFRDKASPWHGGAADFAVTVPPDDRLLGATDRVFAGTGNGGSEATGIRSQLAAWLAQQLDIPYLHATYMQLYRNGSSANGYNVMEDLEQPNNNYAEAWFPRGVEGDLYKVAMWFEFEDNNSGFGATGASIQPFITTGGAYKLASYRWMFQRRANDGFANNYANLLNLVSTINNPSSDFVPRLSAIADIEQWMRCFGFSWIMGNWDMWSYAVGQNMYIYKQSGERWVLMPWDIDFTFGLGDGPSTRLWSGQDPVINTVYDTPEFRRGLWRVYQDAVNSPMLPQRFQPQIDARRDALLKNNVAGLSDPAAIGNYINQRRQYILNQLAANDVSGLTITSNGGNDFSSSSPTTTLTGTAPFGAANITVNGVTYPVSWLDQNTFQVTVPLQAGVNALTLGGRDRKGNPLPGVTDTIRVTYSGTVEKIQDYVVINEISYNPTAAGTAFIEIYNRSGITPFDLSGCRLDGVGYTFPDGAIIQPGAYLLLVADRAAFASYFGQALPVFGEFPGNLDNGGETLTLLKPGTTPALDLRISDVRYDNRLPWSTNAAGLGSSLQLMDPAQDVYRVANWSAPATNAAGFATPGRLNATRQDLTPFAPLWINEVLPWNTTGVTDNAGEREPWIEIYNAGTTNINLAIYYLTDTYTNLTKWRFPNGTIIQPKSFLTVWADGETAESSATTPHTSFRLNPTNGAVALVRWQGNPQAAAVMDYIDYAQYSSDRSIGSYPDGDPRKRRSMYYATPGATNNPALPQLKVTVNEVMAGNSQTLADPADGDFEDWFELHNAGSETVDLTGYSLSDSLTNANRYVIPTGTLIQPGGFLLVWADKETGQNTLGGDLHVDFNLRLSGESIGLFAPDGALIDGVTFGQQTNDVSWGRYPDGALPPQVFLDQPTPRAANFVAGSNLAPTLAPIPNTNIVEQALFSFTALGHDPDAGQKLTYSLSTDAPPGATIDSGTGQFTWTPTEAQGPGIYSLAVVVRDDGTPVRAASQRFSITVLESNRPPQLVVITTTNVNEGSLLTFQASATDPDLPANALTFSLGPGAPAGATINPTTGAFSWTPGEADGPAQRTITIQVTDNGSPAQSAGQAVSVTVNEVNNIPAIIQIAPQTIDELAAFATNVIAADPDTPPSVLNYSFQSAPPGAQIHPSTGLITWTPTEAQGPTNTVFVVRVTESTPPNLSAIMTFGVTVREINQSPILTQVPQQVIEEGRFLSFNVAAQDADLPAQALTYSLPGGAPAGMTIDSTTGFVQWLAPSDFGASTNTVVVRVQDNGPGALAANGTFKLVVQPQFHAAISEIQYRPSAANAEYVEVINNSTRTTVDLSGLRLKGSNLVYNFPAGTSLAPGGHRVVAKNLAAFAAAYPGVLAPVSGPYTGTLGTVADTLSIVRPGATAADDVVLDTVTYGSAAPWPVIPAGSGGALQLVDPTRDNNRIGNWAVGGPYTGPRDLVAMTNTWRYYQDGVLTGTGWTATNFNDSPWSEGAGALYVEIDPLPVPKNTQLAIGRTTYYFRTRFNLASVPAGSSLKLTTAIDDGAVFYLNGRELFRYNMDGNPVTYDSLSVTTVPNATIDGPFLLSGSDLHPGENVLAAEVHQSTTGSSDIVLGVQLELEGGNVASATPGAVNSVAADLAEFPTLRINEVVTSNTTGLADSKNEREPWIEIVNTGDRAVSLDGLYLSNATADLLRWPFPSGYIIPAGGYLVVFADGEPADATLTELHTSFRLATAAGAPWTVLLARDQGGQPAVVDHLSGVVPAPDKAVGRLPDGDPASIIVLATPTPGESNAGPTSFEIQSVDVDNLGRPFIIWDSSIGRSYRVEGRADLGIGNWASLVTVKATDVLTSFTDTTLGSEKRRFYRVVLLP